MAPTLFLPLEMIDSVGNEGKASVAFTINAHGSGQDYPPPPTGDWVIGSVVTVWNTTITLNGNLLILAGGSLTLHNVDLLMNCSTVGQFRIEVQNGGILVTEANSNITTLDKAFAWYLKATAGSLVRLQDSAFSYAGWEWGNHGDRSGLWINTNWAEISNCVISHNFMGIYFCRANLSLIANNRISNSAMDGICLYYSWHNIIEDNIITNSHYCGISLAYSFNCTVFRNTVVNSGLDTYWGGGIILGESPNSIISTNIVINSGSFGINATSYAEAGGALIINNNVTTCAIAGIVIFRDDDSIIANNVVADCEWYGVLIEDAQNCNVTNNVVMNSNYGARLSSATNTHVTGNSFSNNNIGLELASSAHSNYVYHNNFLDNYPGAQAIDNNGSNLFYWGGRGNHWGDNYTGTDGDGDGIGDTPYTISGTGGTTDDYPLMYPTHLGLPPTITIVSPLNTAYSTDTIWVNLTGNAVQYWYSLIGPSGHGNVSWTEPVQEMGLIVGTYTLVAYGNSTIGLVRQVSVTFTITIPRPTVIIVSPINTVYSTNTINVTLAGDAVHYWYFIEGVDSINQSWTSSVLRTLADGTYTLNAYGNNSFGIESWSVGVSFTIDTTPPSVTILNPMNITYTTNTITISLSGNAAHYWYKISPVDSLDQPWTGNVNRVLPDGTYSVFAYGNDSVGNVNSTWVVFTIDTTGPAVTISSPLSTTYVTGTITVSISGDAANYWYFIEGVDLANQSWTVNIGRALADGTYTLNAYGNDSAGNEGWAAVTFTIDTTPPAVSILSPMNTTYTTNTIMISLSGDATHFWYYIEGVDVTNQTWTANIGRALADGTYTLNAYGNDSAGNEGWTAVTFTIDTTPPSVTILSPMNITYTTNTITISLSGNAAHYWYWIGPVDTTDQPWTGNVNRVLPDGTYGVFAYGNDSVGNVNSTIVVFTIDTTEPTVTIESPASTTYASDIVTVALSGDAIHYWYFIEGVDPANQSWTANINRSLADGTYTLNAYGNDSVGNEGWMAVTFTIDTTPPIVTILSPMNITYTTNTINISLSGDATQYWYFIAGVDGANQTWSSITGRSLADGIYTLNAYGRDSAGNEAGRTVTFTIDTTPPSVTILSPLNITYTTNTITISLSGNAVHYWYRIAPIDTTDQPWTTDINRVLPDGYYGIYAYGNDSVGNEGWAAIFFTIDTTEPVVTIVSPINTTYISNTITIALSGDADHYWYFIEGVDATNQSWTSPISRTFVDGTYTLHAYGNDSAGRETKTSDGFMIEAHGSGPDFPPPIIGDWVIDSSVLVWNTTITLNGNLLILDGGSLTLHGVTLYMNCSSDGQYRIEAYAGSHLTIEVNSILTAVNPSNAWGFEARGSTLELFNSFFSYVGWQPTNYITDDYCALFTSTDGAQIINNTIIGNYQGLKLRYVQDAVVANNTFINCSLHGIVLYSSNNNNLIKGNTIKNTRLGIELYYADYNYVSNNNLKNNTADGIRLQSSDHCIISDNSLSDNSRIYAGYGTHSNTISNNTIKGQSIYLRYSRDSLIINNTILESPNYGISIREGYGNITIENNAVLDCIYSGIFVLIYQDAMYNISHNIVNMTASNSPGIYVYGLNTQRFAVSIFNNTVEHSGGSGIQFFRINDSIVQNNTILNCGEGIRLIGSDTNIISSNEAFNCSAFGINIVGSDNNTFTHNSVTSSSYGGISIDSDAEINRIYLNDFIGNNPGGPQAFDDGTNNLFEFNHWNEWTSPDADGDGIVDNSYPIAGSAGATDNYPLKFPVSLGMPPSIVINSPLNIAYNTNTIWVNLTGNAIHYWYSLVGPSGHGNVSWSENVQETGLSDGTYTLYVYGNSTTGLVRSLSVEFTIDTTGPFVTIPSPMNTTYTSGTVIVTLSGDATCYWYFIEGVDTANQTWVGSVGRILPDGTYTLYAYGNDSVSNEGWTTVAFTIDTTPPVVTILSPMSITYTSGTITISLSGDAANYWYFIEGVDAANQTWVGSSTRSLIDGTYALNAYGNDSGGNEAWTTVTFTIDTTPPIVTILSPLNITYTTNTITVSLSGDAMHYWYRIAPADNTDQPWTTDVNRVLPDGVYGVFAFGNDSAGNLNSAVVFFTIDTTGPIVVIGSPSNATYTSETISVILSGDAIHYWYFIEGVDVKNHSWNGVISRSLFDGRFTIHAFGNDSIGLETRTSKTFSIAVHGSGPDYPPPLVGDWVIDSPVTTWNTTITLNGNLLILAGGSLNLHNVTLQVNCSADGQYRIEVYSGGALEIMADSAVLPFDATYAWYLKANAGSSFAMDNSTVEHAGWEEISNFDQSGLWINTDSANITGSTISMGYNGIYLWQVQNCNISYNIITGQIASCIWLSHSSGESIIKANTVMKLPDKPSHAIFIYYCEGNTFIIDNTVNTNFSASGIRLYRSKNVLISGNLIEEIRISAIGLSWTENITITRNTIINTHAYWDSEGISLYESSKCNLSSNMIINSNDYAIMVYHNSNYNNITDNILNNGSRPGIRVSESHYNLLAKNFIANYIDQGILLDSSTCNRITGNVITNTTRRYSNPYGIYATASTSNNSFWGNTLIENEYANVRDDGFSNQWDNGSYGNYWDDYGGIDGDGDGIGDTPYAIIGSGGAADDYPLIYPVYTGAGPTIIAPRDYESISGIAFIQWIPSWDSIWLPVTYSVYYSFNRGDDWELIASGVKSTSCEWNTTEWNHRQNCLIKVVATYANGMIVIDISDSEFIIDNTGK
jgi:parallel beta-helix repeat protein